MTHEEFVQYEVLGQGWLNDLSRYRRALHASTEGP
jgi:hypothetical protein